MNLKNEASSTRHDCVTLADFEKNYMLYFLRNDLMLILNNSDVKYLGGCYLVLIFYWIFTVIKPSCNGNKNTNSEPFTELN